MATATTSTVASPVDFEAYGDYAPPRSAYRREGNLATLLYPIDGRISDDGSTEFAAESGRYHLYFSLYCPWAQRPLIALKLRGLDGVVTSSAVDPVRDGRGWAFRDGPGYSPDPVNGFAFLRDAYLAWEEERVIDWAIRYWEKARAQGLPVRGDFADFYRDFEWMGAQRQLKVLGIFARLSFRDGKDGYLKDQPLVMSYLRRTCERYRELAGLGRLLEDLERQEKRVGYTF